MRTKMPPRPLVVLLLTGVVGAALSLAVARAGTLTTLYSFTGGSDGSQPTAGLAQDTAGVLYGATNRGGASQCAAQPGHSVKGCGTVFSFNESSGLRTLVTFAGLNGANASSTLMLNGTTLYGNTLNGGVDGDGVLFSVQTDGSAFTLLHQFVGTDGQQPDGALQMGAAGILYGITAKGGRYHHGVLFQLARSGAYTILHAFTGGADGADPNALLITKSGALVGSAYSGGTDSVNCGSGASGCGALFSYVPATGRFTVLYSFKGTIADGGAPFLGSIGAANVAYGVSNHVFSFSLASGYSGLAGFTMNDGGYPDSGPAVASSGALIGTTTYGPNDFGGDGTLYQEQNGVITNLYIFGGLGDGGAPAGGPLLTANGNIFGTAKHGGAGCSQYGTIWKYTP